MTNQPMTSITNVHLHFHTSITECIFTLPLPFTLPLQSVYLHFHYKVYIFTLPLQSVYLHFHYKVYIYTSITKCTFTLPLQSVHSHFHYKVYIRHFHYKVHTRHFPLQSAHSTLSITKCTLDTFHYKVHIDTFHYKVHTFHYKVYFTLPKCFLHKTPYLDLTGPNIPP